MVSFLWGLLTKLALDTNHSPQWQPGMRGRGLCLWPTSLHFNGPHQVAKADASNTNFILIFNRVSSYVFSINNK